MGLKDWRSRHAMKDPVRGEFRPTGAYAPHPGRVPMREMLTGVVTAPGVEPTGGEALNDLSHPHDVSGFGDSVLPALVDRANPTRFAILWQEVEARDHRAEARAQAQEAAERDAQADGPLTPPAPEPQAHADDDTGGPEPGGPEPGGPGPDWARQMVDGLRASGISGLGEVLSGALSGQPFIVEGSAQVEDLTDTPAAVDVPAVGAQDPHP
jgi:hypothetical protein